MDTGFDREKLIVGIRQSVKALRNGNVREAFLANDADESILKDFIRECEARDIMINRYDTMAELGRDCGIDIGAAVACRVK